MSTWLCCILGAGKGGPASQQSLSWELRPSGYGAVCKSVLADRHLASPGALHLPQLSLLPFSFALGPAHAHLAY
jgi:hypothetical protein